MPPHYPIYRCSGTTPSLPAPPRPATFPPARPRRSCSSTCSPRRRVEGVVPEQPGTGGVADVGPADEPGLDVGMELLAKTEPREGVLVQLGRIREVAVLPLPPERRDGSRSACLATARATLHGCSGASIPRRAKSLSA